MIEFFNIKKSSGGGDGSSLNVFAQLEEPSVKKGIWLKAEKDIQHINYDEEIFIGGEYMPDGTCSDIPYNQYYCPVAIVGDNVYLFGGTSNSYNLYRYNISTNTYTSISYPSSDYHGFQDSAIAVVGTDIYLLGGENQSMAVFKYNTLTDTYTKLDNLPYGSKGGRAVAIGTDIYLFGGYKDSYSGVKTSYKYDTINNIWTQLADNPCSIGFYEGTIVAIGNTIYLLGSWCRGAIQYNYKYNTIDDTWTQLTDIPIRIASGAAIAYGTDIYMFYSTYTYKYDTINDTWTQLTNIPYSFTYGGGVKKDSKIYLFGGSEYAKKVQVYAIESKEYDTNTLVISQGKYNDLGYEIELFSNKKNQTPPKYAFADAWFYSTELETDIPTYYGDGTQWINIKNPPAVASE